MCVNCSQQHHLQNLSCILEICVNDGNLVMFWYGLSNAEQTYFSTLCHAQGLCMKELLNT